MYYRYISLCQILHLAVVIIRPVHEEIIDIIVVIDIRDVVFDGSIRPYRHQFVARVFRLFVDLRGLRLKLFIWLYVLSVLSFQQQLSWLSPNRLLCYALLLDVRGESNVWVFYSSLFYKIWREEFWLNLGGDGGLIARWDGSLILGLFLTSSLHELLLRAIRRSFQSLLRTLIWLWQRTELHLIS